MYYISDGRVFVKDGEVYRNVGITVKEKVITHREIESVTVTEGTVSVQEVHGAPHTLEEIVAKMGVTEGNPICKLQKAETK